MSKEQLRILKCLWCFCCHTCQRSLHTQNKKELIIKTTRRKGEHFLIPVRGTSAVRAQWWAGWRAVSRRGAGLLLASGGRGWRAVGRRPPKRGVLPAMRKQDRTLEQHKGRHANRRSHNTNKCRYEMTINI